ncbi:MAG TPA: diacylglycerol kinase family protein [Actinophytocola sp.]|jgi:diacylglycerol kinase family enzyme|nr:diacylglycerol kinase family protein [Actinophytocola sp.]
MRLVLVANRRSGSGRTDGERIAGLLTGRGAAVTARAAAAAGVPLAVLPAGTANDFATALNLPRDLERACALAADPAARTRHREVGEANGHPFVNAAAAGLTAPHTPCTVRCDGETVFDGDAWQVVVAVSGAFGGGANIGGTRADDGRLHVAIVPAGSRLALARHGYRMRRAMLTRQGDVPHHRGRVIDVDVAAGTEFNVDGDLRRLEPPRFTLADGGVQVVVPVRR